MTMVRCVETKITGPYLLINFGCVYDDEKKGRFSEVNESVRIDF